MQTTKVAQHEYQNRLLFLAPDTNAAQTLLDQVRRVLAWQSMVEEVDALNLDKHSEKEAKKNCEDAGKRVEASIRETYRYLLAPMQDPDTASGPATLTWEDESCAQEQLRIRNGQHRASACCNAAPLPRDRRHRPLRPNF